MPDPAEDVPADCPARWCDRGFLFGTLGLGVSGAVTIGAMVELADQLHRAFQRMKATVAMVTDVHHPPAGRTITIEDVEFAQIDKAFRIATPMRKASWTKRFAAGWGERRRASGDGGSGEGG